MRGQASSVERSTCAVLSTGQDRAFYDLITTNCDLIGFVCPLPPAHDQYFRTFVAYMEGVGTEKETAESWHTLRSPSQGEATLTVEDLVKLMSNDA